MKEELRYLVGLIKEKTGKTQQEIAMEMGYKKNYISEILSPKGEVSDKFMDAIKLRFSDILKNGKESFVSESLPKYKITKAPKEIDYLNKFIEEKERVIAQIEARRKDAEVMAHKMEKHYEDAQKALADTRATINGILNKVVTNLQETKVHLKAVELSQRVQHQVLMNSLERIEGEPGKLQTELSTLELAFQQGGEQSGSAEDADKRSKG